MYQGSGTFGLFLCHFNLWHIGVNECLQLSNNLVNEPQYSLNHFAGLFCAIVFFPGTNGKLYNCHHDCSNGSKIEQQGLNKFVSEKFHGFGVENQPRM